MSKRPRPLVAGNWKMNGLKSSLKQISKIAAKSESKKKRPNCDIMICPPATLLQSACDKAKGSSLKIGAQDCHIAESGANTGDLSAEMMADAGATAVIVGHSERRADHGEASAVVRAKAQAVYRAGLVAIICIGETAEQRKANRTLSVVTAQLKGSVPADATPANTIVAYEPVWAIGTGLTPTPDDVAVVHAHIRKRLAVQMGERDAQGVRILYGGSVKPGNAAELMAVDNVDGALVGGASLKAQDFLGIAAAYKS